MKSLNRNSSLGAGKDMARDEECCMYIINAVNKRTTI